MLPALRTKIPGPESIRLAGELARYESRNVTFATEGWPVFWERAEGSNVWDADENRFLDLTSAFAVASLGHSPPPVRAALHAQADRLIHAMGDVHPTREKVELCRRLSRITFERWGAGCGKTILASSGSEAVEAALKTAFLATGKPGILSFEGGYHGLGHGALATSGLPFFRDPFAGQLARFAVQVPYPKAGAQRPVQERIQAELDTHPIGAILVEPVQGRGGEIVPDEDFLPRLRELCDARGILLILDEIYTGFGRTGPLFACERWNVVPDLICLGKGLTSGFPLSACVGRSAVMDAWPPSSGEALHTSTFLGHPIGCAMALASIDEHLAAGPMIAAVSTRLDELLGALSSPLIREVRGLGLMRGIELEGNAAAQIVMQALADGILLLAGGPAGDVLSLTPPFVISDDELTHAIGRIQEYLTSLAGSIS